MHAPYLYQLQQQRYWLSPERMVFWEEEKALVVSDLHFGKTGHFRKSGIAVPQSVYKEDLQRLVSQLQYFQPRQLIVVGDMFHSHANKELDLFKRWRHDFPDLSVRLVKGNHDILQESWYKELQIETSDELSIREVAFKHDITSPDSTADDGRYFFSGHIHPGIHIRGMAKQSLSFPCFYFSPSFCVLPAFSRFTGLAMIRPGEGDQVFAIVNHTIIPC
ncbi:MAG TPA: ligase-associated DNA damage response endonuclease PdeM [Chitinophagaceae bacterium]|jgi:DNA ligase-associated metallophosphoesterase